MSVPFRAFGSRDRFWLVGCFDSFTRMTHAYLSVPFESTRAQVDLQLESGEYFLNEQQRKLKKKQEKMAK